MKRVVSVSLGSSKRDKTMEAEFLGERFSIERRGVDGDLKRARRLITELDGEVDAIGLGGIDLYLIAGGRRYIVRDALRLAQAAERTPVVDGSGLKRTWERAVVRDLAERGLLHPHQDSRGLRGIRVLLTSAVDRPGMAEALAELGARTIFGDVMFALRLPVPLTRLWQVRLAARLLLPLICRQPFERLYPTGSKQEQTTPRCRRQFAWADVIAGDYHFVRRFMPPPEAGRDPLHGKTLLTNTITESDVPDLRARGLARLITTTPDMEGRSFGANVMEAVVVALLGTRPEDLTDEDYLSTLERLQWRPRVVDL